MKPTIKQRWLEALRSGKYKQGKGELLAGRPGDEQQFCCLGVLCDLHRKSTKKVGWNYEQFSPRYLGNDTFLPKEVVAWAGLEDNVNGERDVVLRNKQGEPLADTLAEANDGGKRFKTIANLIEKYL